MTKTEYESLRAKIEERYRGDLAALERVRELLHGDDMLPDETPSEPSAPKRRGRPAKKLSKSEAMKASWARRRAKVNIGEPGVKNFEKFLVPGPLGAGGNGER